MKIVLKRRSSTFQDAESYMRVVFAHISDRVWLRSVQVEGKKTNPFGQMPSFSSPMSPHAQSERIIVECQPQGCGNEDARFVAMIKEAISLRGDLSIEQISANPSFGNRGFGADNDDSPDSIEDLLSRMGPIPGMVSPRAAMNLFAQQQRQPQRPIVMIPAIKQIGPNAFEVDDRFATFVARKPDYLQSLLTSNVIKVLQGYEKLDETTLRYTGEIQTQTQGAKPAPFDSKNVYHCFAHAVNANKYLKDKLANSEIEGVTFVVKPDGQVLVNVTLAEHYSAKLPLVANAEELDVTKPTKDAPAHDTSTSSPRP